MRWWVYIIIFFLILGTCIILRAIETYAGGIEKEVNFGRDIIDEPAIEVVNFMRKEYAKADFDILKADTIAVFDNYTKTKPTQEQARTWIALVNYTCPKIQINNFDTSDEKWVEQINNYLKNGCK